MLYRFLIHLYVSQYCAGLSIHRRSSHTWRDLHMIIEEFGLSCYSFFHKADRSVWRNSFCFRLHNELDAIESGTRIECIIHQSLAWFCDNPKSLMFCIEPISYLYISIHPIDTLEADYTNKLIVEPYTALEDRGFVHAALVSIEWMLCFLLLWRWYLPTEPIPEDRNDCFRPDQTR